MQVEMRRRTYTYSRYVSQTRTFGRRTVLLVTCGLGAIRLTLTTSPASAPSCSALALIMPSGKIYFDNSR